jgi:hypothetical protein
VLIAAICGGVGAMFISPLAEWIHCRLGGGELGRVTAWSLFGSSIGLSEAINNGGRWWRGVLGGVLGGTVGGFVLEHCLDPTQHDSHVGTLAIALLGMCIIGLMTLFVQVLSDAWLEGLDGTKVAGHVYQLGKYRSPSRAMIGSAQSGVLVWIPEAESEQATISLTDAGAELRCLAKSKPTIVEGGRVSSAILRDGDVIQIGNSRLRYRQSSVTRFLLSLTKRSTPTSKLTIR